MIPFVQLSNKDIEDFYDNPVDFIRKMKDVTETYYSCRHSAVEFILVFVSIGETEQGENPTLDEFLKYLFSQLEQASSAGSEGFKYFDALLFVIERLFLLISRKRDLFPSIDEVLYKFALPGLKSDSGLMKYRALKLYDELSM